MAINQWARPIEISDAKMAFPTSVRHLLPAYASIPDEFMDQWNPYVKKTSQWFYKGIKKSELKPKAGIDAETAFRHLRAILGSWEPKHEHKEAGVAYLMSLWFDL